MAVAIMGQGYFTKCGHYIVLSGVSTIGGYNYFNVLDPHRDNPNYVTGGGLMIDNAANDGKVAARTSIFASQCEEYWVFSTAGSSTYDDMYKAKLNLEKLNYSGLRGSNGTLNSAWDKAFNNVLWQFLSDYGLKEKYNSLPDSEKKINLFIWIQQAVNGQRDKTTASGGNSEGKVDNNNSSNTQVVTISTVNSSFYDGVKEAVNSNKDSLWKMINNPFKTAVDLSKGVSFLATALNPGTNENTLLAKILYETIQKTSGDFISSNGNARAKMVGRAVGEIVIGLIGAKGLNVALDALKYAANTGKFMGIVNDVKAGKKCDDVYNAIKVMAEAEEQLIKGFWNMDEAGSIINGRRYSKHALERMAPNNPEVRAELYKRATDIAKSKGLKPTTKEYSDFVNKYVDPRNIPPMVIEDAIKNTTAIPGNTSGTFLHETESVKVVVNQKGDVITVIPK